MTKVGGGRQNVREALDGAQRPSHGEAGGILLVAGLSRR